MAEFAGYLSQNASRSFPFREPESGAGAAPPEDFLLSLRLYLCADQRVDAFLSSLAYDAGADAYTLAFQSAADDSVLLAGTLPRQNAGASRVGVPTALGAGARLAILSPGSLWDQPAVVEGAGSWTLAFGAGAASVEPSQCVPGPATFRQLAVNAEPFAVDPPLGVSLALTAGCGVEFSLGRTGLTVPSPGGTAATPGATTLTLTAGNGLGEPFVPTSDPTLYVTTLGGQAPDTNGAFVLGALDCLRVVQPVVGGVGGAPATLLPNTLQLSNDCGPCCGCSDYRRVAKAIARRGAKLADLCAATQAALATAYAQYQAVAAQVNLARHPLVVTENLFAQDNVLYFTVRNAVEIPLYVYVALEMTSSATLPLLTLNNSSSLVAYLGSTGADTGQGGVTFASLVAADQAALPPLISTPFDHAGWPFPFTGSDNVDAGWVFRVNTRDAGGNLLPLPAGAGFRLAFALTNADGTDPGTEDPLAAPVAAGLGVTLRATSLQGAPLANPYAGSTLRNRLVAGNPAGMGGYDAAAYVGVVPAP